MNRSVDTHPMPIGSLLVHDIDESFNFYREILGFKPLFRWERGAYFLAGNLWFCLSLDGAFKAPKSKGHIALTATESLIENVKVLIKQNLLVEWTQNTSEGNSVYFLDPSGNQLELHVGDWETRLAYIKKQPYKGKIDFFD
ncbi:MAG: VOC family protein [Bdellovibrionaceae bacterium]|nr:VOC family protein [Pseudobdellovibrionaceae bacterium]